MPGQVIELPLSMPGEAKQRSFCAKCIAERLSSKRGIRSVRVRPGEEEGGGEGSGTLELDYDPTVVSLWQINGYLRMLGSCFGPSIAHVVLPVTGVASPRHEKTIETRIDRLPGVRCSVSYASQTIRLEFDRAHCALPDIVRQLDQLGVTLKKQEDGEAAGPVHPKEAPAATLSLPQPSWLRAALSEHDILLAVLAGVFLAAGFLVHVLGGPEQTRIALLLVSYVCGGFYPAQDLVRTLARFRLDIDLLMFAAAFGAASLGHYEEGALLLFLFSLGGAGERLAMNRARRAIGALAKLAPSTAMLVQEDGSRREVPVEDLRVSDQVFVAPGQQIPADGRIISGNSAVDQSPITGESVPVDKAVDDEVFAGTINGDGALVVEVRKMAADNTLSKVIRLVEEAQTTKSPTQLFTDRVEKWYVPLVVVATAGLVVIPPLLQIEPAREHQSHWAGWFYQAMAFLTAASPCALAIGTPAAVLSGIGRAARDGVLMKGGVHLESLGRVRAIAFDKTGTLTYGRPEVTDVMALDSALSEKELLGLAASVEQGSHHPIAEAIVNEAVAQDCPMGAAKEIDQTPGVGIRGVVDGRVVTLGRESMFGEDLGGIAEIRRRATELEEKGRTVVVVADGKKVLGLVALADKPRPEARQMVAALKRLGIRHTIMLTGDNPRTAAAIAASVGVDEYLAELLPADKLQKVRELDQRYGRVAMVGDGVNDAPAMANASVGIAIGGASGGGSDVALETADVVLMANDLGRLPEAIGVSRFSRRIIIQNLVIALGVIAVLAPVAALGGAPISLAVLFHEGSTVVVVLNALRILAYRGNGR